MLTLIPTGLDFSFFLRISAYCFPVSHKIVLSLNVAYVYFDLLKMNKKLSFALNWCTRKSDLEFLCCYVSVLPGTFSVYAYCSQNSLRSE